MNQVKRLRELEEEDEKQIIVNRNQTVMNDVDMGNGGESVQETDKVKKKVLNDNP